METIDQDDSKATADLAQRLKEAQIPARFSDCTTANFEVLHPSLARAQMAVKKYVEEYPKVDVGLLFLGRHGVGKTHLAVAALKGLIEKGAVGRFCSYGKLNQGA